MTPTKGPARVWFFDKHTHGRLPRAMKLTESFESSTIRRELMLLF